MTVSGPSFVALQVRDIARSARFYEERLGLTRQPGPPHAVVFDTRPIALAVRTPDEGVDLDDAPYPGIGTALWLHASDAQELHDALTTVGVSIVTAPYDGPFGRTFAFADPDGYHITVHDRTP